MVQRPQFIICMLALICVGRYAMAQTPPTKDFQQWTQITAAWQARPRLTLTTFGEVHLGNVSQFDQEIISVGITYSRLKWISFGTGYLYLHANPNLSGISYENRIFGEITFHAPAFHKFQVSDRVRPELRWEQLPARATFTQRYRNRISLERVIKFRGREYALRSHPHE